MTGSDIDYVCAAPVHVAASTESSDTQLYEGSWAYCHAGVIEAHDWRSIVRMQIDDLICAMRLPEAMGVGFNLGSVS